MSQTKGRRRFRPVTPGSRGSIWHLVHERRGITMAHGLTTTFRLCASVLVLMCMSFSTVQAQGGGEAVAGKGAPTSSAGSKSHTESPPFSL